jgi:hypothetical protein
MRSSTGLAASSNAFLVGDEGPVQDALGVSSNGLPNSVYNHLNQSKVKQSAGKHTYIPAVSRAFRAALSMPAVFAITCIHMGSEEGNIMDKECAINQPPFRTKGKDVFIHSNQKLVKSNHRGSRLIGCLP